MARLEYIDNTGSRAVHTLRVKENVAIGRDPGSDIYTNNPSVSRRHGRVFFADDSWSVRDLGSSNGTYVNDEQVDEQTLQDVDQIRCGDFVITFYAGEAVDDTRKPKRSPKRKQALKETADQGPGASTESSAQKAADEVPKKTRIPRKALRDSKPKAPRETGESRKRIRAVKGDEQSGSAEARYVRQIKEQAAELETLSQDRDEAQSMVKELEHRLEELETKSIRYEVELDSMAEKYVQIKDQLSLSRERLDETREELAEREDQIFQFEARVRDLDTELESARERVSASSEHVSTFKIKLTQKERQIEDLQRQYDLMEYEFRAAREELRALQEDSNNDEFKTQRLEKRINQLREVIVDKENVIAELRLDLENKDIEIRQVKLGMGLTDLEDEKRKLLEDYYEKNREVDRLRDELEIAGRDHTETKERLAEVAVELERKSQPVDIEVHPEFKAKMREVGRLQEQLAEQTADAATLQQQLDEFSSDDRKKLENEIETYKRKVEAQEEKLGRAQEQIRHHEAAVAELQAAESSGLSEVDAERLSDAVRSMRADVSTEVDTVIELLATWRGNFTLFNTYLKEVGDAIDLVMDASPDSLPDALQGLRTEANLGESMESVRDLIRVVAADAASLKKGLAGVKKGLSQG